MAHAEVNFLDLTPSAYLSGLSVTYHAGSYPPPASAARTPEPTPPGAENAELVAELAAEETELADGERDA